MKTYLFSCKKKKKEEFIAFALLILIYFEESCAMFATCKFYFRKDPLCFLLQNLRGEKPLQIQPALSMRPELEASKGPIVWAENFLLLLSEISRVNRNYLYYSVIRTCLNSQLYYP